MNAGAHGSEMQDIICSTTYLDFNGSIKTLTVEEQEFGYRQSIFSKQQIGIILETELELKYGEQDTILETMKKYSMYRKEKQPISYPNAGSIFKRGKDYITAKLIEESGLKGYQIGGAKVSELHAGFIINTGEATANDILELIEIIKQKVYEKFR